MEHQMPHLTTATNSDVRPTTGADPTVVLDLLLRRARRKMAADVRRGVLSEAQARALFRAQVRRCTRSLGLPLPLTA